MPDVFPHPPGLTDDDAPDRPAGGGTRPVIAIIGGGFAGAVLAIKLLDTATAPLLVKIVEPRSELGRGLAYSTRDPAHVMNGPAKVFSLYPERPDHFVRYLARYGREWGWRDPSAPDFANAHASRWVFGDYVRAELARAVAHAAPGVSLQHVAAEAHDITPDDTGQATAGLAITLADGQVLRADQAVLALGVFPSRPDLAVDPALIASGRYVVDPWNLERMEALPRRGRVLLIGCGLTMLDAMLTLERHGHRGSYLAISRHGLGLHPRRDVTPLSDFLGERRLPSTALSLLRAARTELANAPHGRPDWQALVMAIRPHVGTLWQRAPEAERRRFQRHLRRIWEISLHRAAPQSVGVMERGRTEGWFTHRAGRLLGLCREGERIAADVVWRGAAGASPVVIDAAVNCTGAQPVWARITDRPLVRNLLAAGMVRAGPLGFGIDADMNAGVIGRNGQRSAVLTAVGPPLRGVRWESSTVAEVLQQTIQLADGLLSRVHPGR